MSRLEEPSVRSRARRRRADGVEPDENRVVFEKQFSERNRVGRYHCSGLRGADSRILHLHRSAHAKLEPRLWVDPGASRDALILSRRLWLGLTLTLQMRV